MVNNTFPCDDKVAGWGYYSGSYTDGLGFAGIWRPLNDEYTQFRLIHKTELPTKRYSSLTSWISPGAVAVRKGNI